MGVIEKIVVSDEALQQLREQADRRGQTVEELLAQRIERDAARKRDGSIDYVAWSRRIRAMTPRNVPQTDSLAMLREDRDR